MLRRPAFPITAVVLLLTTPLSIALPPPEDLPEEVLRTEMITEGRSPIDGEPVTAKEYAEIQQEQAERNLPPTVNADIQHTIFLLRLRKLLQTISPF
ncbi:hypothetical protein [Picosynechococcus sp. PCC 73109]|uniref:hypothetical protein n=1 Tax=Picosynechococcus sp. PCC 73109 TaxID=374982 RepID=UPI0007457C78|nr:hypothetical protein [Picosynechococcus sp. PCC 73109]AMA08552.1 hypothetical protein AWQ23_04040 [Picosynechococcus sp. PCC 73109]